MKKIAFLTLFMFCTLLSKAQNIYIGSEIINNERKEGYYMVLFIKDKYIEKEWKNYIAMYGKVESQRNTYKINNAKMPFISPDTLNFVSTIRTINDNTVVFCMFDLGGGKTVSGKLGNYKEVEKLMSDFYVDAMIHQEIRFAEDDLDEAQKNYERTLRDAKKIEKDIENTKKEKDALLSKADKNSEEYKLFSENQQTADSLLTIADKEKLAKSLKKNTKEKSSLEKKLDKNKEEFEGYLKDKKANEVAQEDALVFIQDKKNALRLIQSKL